LVEYVGKNITVGKSNKTLHSVLARCTSKNDDKSRKTVESKCVGSKEEEVEGYNTNRGYDLLSKTWSREEREKQNRNRGREVERADEALRGNKDNIEGENEESANEINDRNFTMTKRKYAREQQNVGSPAKATMIHTTRGEEERWGRR
jgi:hypothetical protein